MTSELAERDAWDTHWDRYAEATESNPAELMRFKLVLRFLGLGDRAARVVDIGSGQGDLISILAAEHPRTESLGVELSQTGVEIGRGKVPSAQFLQWDLLQPQLAPGRWAGWGTHAICSEVLEHVDEPITLLENARRFLAPGCRLVVTVPGGPRSAFDHHIGHRRHYAPRDLNELLVRAGFQNVRTFGAGFPFFNLYRLVVILRGRRLVEDITRQEDGASLSLSARLVMKAFDLLFRFNLPRGRWGWQTVGVARMPR